MKIYIAILFIVRTLYVHTAIERELLHRSAMFTEIFYNKYLNTSILASHDVKTLLQCTSHCIRNSECKSVNTKKTITGIACNLLSKDRRDVYINDFITGDGWSYYDTG